VKKLNGVIKFSSLFVIVVTFGVGCSYKSTPKNEHEAAVDTVVHAPPDKEIAAIAGLDLSTFFESTKKIAANNDLDLAESLRTVKELKKFVLNPEYIENPKYNENENIKVALEYFNYAFLNLITNKKISKEELENYVKTAERGCDSRLSGCLNLRYFSMDSKSAEILASYVEQLDTTIDTSADTLSTLRRYYKILNISQVMKNARSNDKISFLFVKRAKQYAILLEAQNNNQDRTEKDLLGKAFEQMIDTLEKRKSDPQVSEFIKNFKPWTYSRLNADAFPYGTQKIFSIAAQTQLYDDKGVLNADFVDALTRSQMPQEKDSLGLNFSQTVELIKTNYPDIVRMLPIGPIDNKSEYFFIVDRLYRGHLGVDEMTQIWRAAREKNGAQAWQKLDDTISNYLRWEFVRLVISTNDYVKQFYSKGNFDPKELVTKVIENSREKDSSWVGLNRRAESIKMFVQQNIDVETLSKDSSKSVRLIDSIPRNAKYLASYPNMMLLAYMLQKLESGLTIDTWFGKVEISSGIVINAFLNGDLAPWFNFSKDSVPLNQPEIMIAYDYALKTGAFATLKSGGKFNVNELDFLKAIIKTYFTDELKKIQDAETDLIDKITNSDFTNFKTLCAGPADLDMSWDDLKEIALIGNGGNMGATGLSGAALKYAGNEANSPFTLLFDLNSSFQRKKVIASMLGKILQDYYISKGGKKEDIDQTVQSIKDEIDKVQISLKQYYSELFKVRAEIEPCYDRLRKIEKEIIYDVLTQEKQYLGEVFDSLSAMKNLTGNSLKDASDKLLAKSGNKLDSVEEGPSYRYRRLGFYYRALERLQHTKSGYRVSVKSMPSDTDLKKFDIGSIKLELTENGVDLTKDAFVKKGLQKLNGQTGSFINWMSNLNESAVLNNRIRLLLEMYHTGIALGVPDDQRVRANLLIEETYKLMQAFNISAEEKPLLSDLGLDYRVSPILFTNYFYRGIEPQSPYDYTFKLLKDKMDKSDLNAAEDFYQTKEGIGFFLFDLRDKFISDMKEKYTPLVKNYEKFFTEFLNTLSTCQKTNVICSQPPNVTFTLRETTPIYQGLPDQSTSLLNVANRDFFTARMEEFHKKTKSDFKESQ
jgi:hypothetical protein